MSKKTLSNPEFNLTLKNDVLKTFASDLTFSDLVLNVEGRKVLIQKISTNHKTTYFP